MSGAIIVGTKSVSGTILYRKSKQILCSTKIVLFLRQGGKSIVQPNRPHMTIWVMRIACWVSKATDTSTEYVIPIVFEGENDYAKVLYHFAVA
jgi:hypothetical protein